MSVPFDRQLWTAQECADYLGHSYSQFMKRTQHSAGFPKRLELPGQPRWRAVSVSDWALGSRTQHEPASQVPDLVAR